jgi:hypothetical protein
MKPGDHPEFFRFPAPEGRSRESTIRLDRHGDFFHDDQPVDHPKLRDAMHTWLARHPDDGRYILTNGYDWTYLRVDDVPYFVRTVRAEGGDAILTLSDATEEPLDPATVHANPRGELYLKVKPGAPGGAFDAKMSRFAQTQLGPFLEPDPSAPNRVVLATKRGRTTIPVG